MGLPPRQRRHREGRERERNEKGWKIKRGKWDGKGYKIPCW